MVTCVIVCGVCVCVCGVCGVCVVCMCGCVCFQQVAHVDHQLISRCTCAVWIINLHCNIIAQPHYQRSDILYKYNVIAYNDAMFMRTIAGEICDIV